MKAPLASVLLSALFPLAAFGQAPPDPPSPRPTPSRAAAGDPRATTVFDCGTGGQRLFVRPRLGGMLLTEGQRTWTLSELRAASGSKYTNGLVTFWSKGDEAMYQRGGPPPQTCRAAGAATPWEDAGARGVVFRALGQGPVWSVDVTPEGRTFLLEMATDQGRTRTVVRGATAQAQEDPPRTRWVGTGEGSRVEVAAEWKPCTDPMSGEPFEAAVTVTAGGRTFQGCGRLLR